jgi:quinoprotein glucose dehydrogenase
VKARWEKQQAAWKGGGDALAPYRSALAGGDPHRGAQQFFENAVLPCARCHKVFGEGGEAGPNLSRVGAQHPVEYLLESVVKPNAHIAQGFDIVSFTLANGETESGSVVSESATQIVVKRGDGSQAMLDPKQIKQRAAAPSSMPEIYAQVLTREQLRDVVAFLHALDGRRPAQAPPDEGIGVSNRAMQSVATEGPTGGHP